MSKDYEGPIFDAIHTDGQRDAVVVPERYLEVPQNRIMDMLPNQPGMAAAGSVYRDRTTGHRFIDTFDSLAKTIKPAEITQRPFIYHAMVDLDLGKTSLDCYLVDYRRVESLMYPSVDIDYDPNIGLDSISNRRLTYGTLPVQAAIMRYGGEVHYIGERILVEAARIFAESVDDLLDGPTDKSGNYPCPAYPEDSFASFHQPDDIKASLDCPLPENKLR